MKEANKYYVTVAVDHCVIPRGVMIYAKNEEAAAKRAEMKIALQMRDAITVKAIMSGMGNDAVRDSPIAP